MDDLFDCDSMEEFMNASLFLVTACVIFIYMSAVFLIALRKKRADLADVAWGGGFFVLCWTSFGLSDFSPAILLVNSCISIWAIRLTWHIYQRNRNRDEDFRYKVLQSGWKKNHTLQLFLNVFLVQGVVLYCVALPILWIHLYGSQISSIHLYGSLFVWFIGFLLEAVSDKQLAQFKSDAKHRGHLFQGGLWAYSRHPNYLGELIQWWAIWSLAVLLPMGWICMISPLLITYLIVKVTGIAPLEKKMATHPEFKQYAENTPSLVPISWFNGAIYSLSWLVIVFYGGKDSVWIPLGVAVLSYCLQLVLVAKLDKKSFFLAIPLSIYTLVFGVLQEILFIHIPIIEYANSHLFPPIWVIVLYPLFSFSLNANLSFMNRNLFVAFLLGGSSAVLFYYLGNSLGMAHFLSPLVYPVLFLSWGCFLTSLFFLNRKLIKLVNEYAPCSGPLQPITVFFDALCPVCYREMEALKKRKQTGVVHYIALESEGDLKYMTSAIGYKEAMKTIHGIDSQGRILKGVDTLSALYARTNLPLLAIFLQAPGFYQLFCLFYRIWAQYRFRIRS